MYLLEIHIILICYLLYFSFRIKSGAERRT